MLKSKKQPKPFRRKSPMKRAPSNEVLRRRMRAIGKKAKENRKVVREKKAELIKLGITSCELRTSGHCTPFDNLSFAHTLKRRHMGKWGSQERAENMNELILACNFCHDNAELQGEEKMRPIILAAIADRANRLTEAA